MDKPTVTRASVRRLIAFVTFSVAVASCAGQPMQVPESMPSPTSTARSGSPSGTAAPRPTFAPTATPRPSTGLVAGSWTIEKILPEFEVRDLAVISGQIVAIGCRVPNGATACAGAAIETSIDGGWVPARLEGDTERVELAAVGAGAGGFVAVGRVFGSEGAILHGVAFASSDGRTWRRAPEQASLEGRTFVDVVARPGGGWIAVGARVGPTVLIGIDTWSSSDGSIWTLIGSLQDDGLARGVTMYGGGFIAWGTDCPDVCGPPKRAALWMSKDNNAWARVPDQPALVGGQIDAVIEMSGGALAVGTTYDDDGIGSGAAWRTADGTSWTRVALPDSSGHQSFRLASTTVGYVTVGARSGDNGSVWGTWSSSDGATWRRLPGADVRSGTLELVASDPGVIGVALPAPAERSDSHVLRLGLQ